jgi:hypothetical protein
MAIDGEGFFPVKDKEGAIYYTRQVLSLSIRMDILSMSMDTECRGLIFFQLPGMRS